MDGHFVPPLSMGPPVCRALRDLATASRGAPDGRAAGAPGRVLRAGRRGHDHRPRRGHAQRPLRAPGDPRSRLPRRSRGQPRRRRSAIFAEVDGRRRALHDASTRAGAVRRSSRSRSTRSAACGRSVGDGADRRGRRRRRRLERGRRAPRPARRCSLPAPPSSASPIPPRPSRTSPRLRRRASRPGAERLHVEITGSAGRPQGVGYVADAAR